MDDPVNFTNPSSLVPCVLCLNDPQISDLMGQEHKAMGGGGGGWKTRLRGGRRAVRM